MRKIIISDIHGFYNEFKELLAKVSYNREKRHPISAWRLCG